MTEHERQLFVRSVHKRGADDAILVQLFDAIAHMVEYDEAALIASFDHEPLRRGFASYKHHLYTMVLRFVASQDDEMPLPELLSAVQHVETLTDRGLYSQAWRQLKRALVDATRIDAFDVQWRLLQQERNIVLIRQERHFSEETLAEALQRIDSAIEATEHRLQQVNALRRIQRQLTTLNTALADAAPVQITDSLVEALGADGAAYEVCSSITASILWHHVHILFYGKVQRNPDAVHAHAARLLSLLETTPDVARAFSMHLMRAAATFATASTWIGDMDGVRRAIDILHNAPARFSFRRTAAMQTLTLQGYTYQAVLRDETLDFDHIDAFLEECLSALDRYAVAGRRLFADELRIYVAKLALLCHRLHVVHTVASEVLRHKSPSRPDVRSFMRQVTCIASLLSEDYDAVDAVATSALRNAKADQLAPSLDSFFRTAQKYCSTLDKASRTTLLQSHVSAAYKVASTLNTHDAAAERAAPHMIWAIAILNGRPMLDTYCEVMHTATSSVPAQSQ